MTEKESSAVAEATGNVSTRAKHAITSGNAVFISNSLCYLTFKQFPSQMIDMWQVRPKLPWQNLGGLGKIWGPVLPGPNVEPPLYLFPHCLCQIGQGPGCLLDPLLCGQAKFGGICTRRSYDYFLTVLNTWKNWLHQGTKKCGKLRMDEKRQIGTDVHRHCLAVVYNTAKNAYTSKRVGLKIEIHEIHQNLRNPVSLIGL